MTNVKNRAEDHDIIGFVSPERVLCVVAWVRLQGDPGDMEAEGTKDEGGHM